MQVLVSTLFPGGNTYMDKKQEQKEADQNHAERPFTEVKNAHAAGDGAIEKSDEHLDVQADHEDEPEPHY